MLKKVEWLEENTKMLKHFIIGLVALQFSSEPVNSYPWTEGSETRDTLVSRIEVPPGYNRVEARQGSFGQWLRGLPLLPKGSKIKLWHGKQKHHQNDHVAVVDMDFIGRNLQQCIDVIIRLRAEYLWSINRADEVKFSYSCCREKISWKKWRSGWRAKFVKANGRRSLEWVKSNKANASRQNFRRYLFNIMMFAGTHSLSRDMKKASEVQIGDAFVQGGAAGYGHGVIVLDEAVSSSGKRIILLGQSYNPAEQLNVLKSGIKDISPWFYADFGEELRTPGWTFNKDHVRRF
jgi:hypothetical protein